MKTIQTAVRESVGKWCAVVLIAAGLLAVPTFAQKFVPNDPGEPPHGRTKLNLLPRPAGAIARQLR